MRVTSLLSHQPTLSFPTGSGRGGPRQAVQPAAVRWLVLPLVPAAVVHDPLARRARDPLDRQLREARGGHCGVTHRFPEPHLQPERSRWARGLCGLRGGMLGSARGWSYPVLFVHAPTRPLMSPHTPLARRHCARAVRRVPVLTSQAQVWQEEGRGGSTCLRVRMPLLSLQ